MFKITNAWLKEFGTPCGPTGFSWNAKQLKTIGVSYPLVKGWTHSIIGHEISEEKKIQFENLKGHSKHLLKVKRAQNSGELLAFYITTPDGKGSWTGRWGNEHRWDFRY